MSHTQSFFLVVRCRLHRKIERNAEHNAEDMLINERSSWKSPEG